MAYSDDSDLLKIRPDILSLGVSSWSEKHDEAALIIDRAIDSEWYRSIALDNNVDYQEFPFDGTLLVGEGSQLLRLSCYKTLELIYLSVQKNTAEDDGFERQRKIFLKMYKEEFVGVLGSGMDYDWDRSGAISIEERSQPTKRRLTKA